MIEIMLLTAFQSNSKVKVREMHFSFWKTLKDTLDDSFYICVVDASLD